MAKTFLRNAKDAKKLTVLELSKIIEEVRLWPENYKALPRQLLKHIWALQFEADKLHDELREVRQKKMFEEGEKVKASIATPKLVEESKFTSPEERAFEMINLSTRDPKAFELYVRFSRHSKDEILKMAHAWAKKQGIHVEGP